MICTKYKSKTSETFSGTLLFVLMVLGYDMDVFYVYICKLSPDTTNNKKSLTFLYIPINLTEKINVIDKMHFKYATEEICS